MINYSLYSVHYFYASFPKCISNKVDILQPAHDKRMRVDGSLQTRKLLIALKYLYKIR